MDRRRKHLNSKERGVMLAKHEFGRGKRAMGRMLGRPASIICRGLARGRQVDDRYCPQAAPRVYGGRRRRCRCRRKLAEGSALHRVVHGHLVYQRWSPEHIAQRLGA